MKKTIIIVLLLVLLVGGTLVGNAVANQAPTVTRYAYAHEDIPPAFAGYRIMLIADLHNAPFSNEILAIAEAERPDLVLFCGDMVQLPGESTKQARRIAAGLTERLPDVPIYAVTGNHESQNEYRTELAVALEESGITLLRDEVVPLVRGDAEALLIGAADPEYEFVMKHQYTRLKEKIADAVGDGAGFAILLNHRADMYPGLQDSGVDLILSGHLHGGLVRLPWIGGIIGRGGELFPDYAYGCYDGGDGADLIVSGGCDKNEKKPRLFNRPEVVLVELVG